MYDTHNLICVSDLPLHTHLTHTSDAQAFSGGFGWANFDLPIGGGGGGEGGGGGGRRSHDTRLYYSTSSKGSRRAGENGTAPAAKQKTIPPKVASVDSCASAGGMNTSTQKI